MEETAQGAPSARRLRARHRWSIRRTLNICDDQHLLVVDQSRSTIVDGLFPHLMERRAARPTSSRSNGCAIWPFLNDVLALFHLKERAIRFQIQFHKIGHALLQFKKKFGNILFYKNWKRSERRPLVKAARTRPSTQLYLLALPL